MRPIKAAAPLAQINGGGGDGQVERLQDNSISLRSPVKTLKHSERRSSAPLICLLADEVQHGKGGKHTTDYASCLRAPQRSRRDGRLFD